MTRGKLVGMSLVGLLVLYALTWVSCSKHIEQHLRTRAFVELQREGFVVDDVQFDGRDGRVVLASTESGRDNLAQQAAVEISGVRQVSVEVAEPEVIPPNMPEIEVRLANETVTITGYVPTVDLRNEIIRSAQQLFGAQYANAELEVDPSASGDPRVGSRLGELLSVLRSNLPDGAAALSGPSITVTGAVDEEGHRDQLETALTEALGAGVEVSNELVVAPLQSRMDALLRGRVVAFAPGSARVLPQSIGLLDSVSVLLNRYPAGQINVEGHTDSDGTAETNLQLSQRRSESVVRYLVARGIAGERLAAVGRGDTRPLLPNTTPEGKAKNRRVEIIVR